MLRFSSLFGLSLVVLLLGACRSFYTPQEATPENYRMMGELPETHPLEDMIAPYRKDLGTEMNVVLADAGERLYKERPESPLGNWVADALFVQVSQISDVRIDAVVQNYGGIRISELAAGPVTVGNIYELMPFDNTLVIMELKGRMVQRLFDHIAADGGWPVSKEVQFILEAGKAVNLKLSGRPIRPDQVYNIALPDYVANGGNDAGFLKDQPRRDTGKLVRDLLLAQAKATGNNGAPLMGQLTNRIILGD